MSRSRLQSAPNAREKLIHRARTHNKQNSDPEHQIRIKKDPWLQHPSFPIEEGGKERRLPRIENKKEKSISVWIWVVQEISVIARRLQRICPKNDWGQRSSWGQIKLKGDVRVSRLTLELVQTGLREGRGARRPLRVPKSRATKKNEFNLNRLFP